MIPPKKIKNIARALLLPQKQDLVRASFNESELAVWDLRCHPAGVGGLYEIPYPNGKRVIRSSSRDVR